MILRDSLAMQQIDVPILPMAIYHSTCVSSIRFTFMSVIILWLVAFPVYAHIFHPITINIQEEENYTRWTISMAYDDAVVFIGLKDMVEANKGLLPDHSKNRELLSANKTKFMGWLEESIKLRNMINVRKEGLIKDPDINLYPDQIKYSQLPADTTWEYPVRPIPLEAFDIIYLPQEANETNINGNVEFQFKLRKTENQSHLQFSQHFDETEAQIALRFFVNFEGLNKIKYPPLPIVWGEIARIPFYNSLSIWGSMLRFGEAGFWHILEGYDHLALLVGLALIHVGIRPLLISVTIFTLAHCLTLLLAGFEVFSLPPRFVEPLIAMTVAISGWHAWMTTGKLKNTLRAQTPTFWYVGVFIIGLIHGLGFSFLLKDLLRDKSSITYWLFSFNIGIEIGQICFLSITLLVLFLLTKTNTKTNFYTRYLMSFFLIVFGLYWTLIKVS